MSDYIPPISGGGSGGGNVTAASAVTLSTLPDGVLFISSGEVGTSAMDVRIKTGLFPDGLGFFCCGVADEGEGKPFGCGTLYAGALLGGGLSIANNDSLPTSVQLGAVGSPVTVTVNGNAVIADGNYTVGTSEIQIVAGLIMAINEIV